MKTISSFFRFSFFIILFLFATSTVFSQQYYVANTSNTSDIKVSNDEINEYLMQYKNVADIQEMIVLQDINAYFLLAKDKLHNWVYCFYLKDDNGQLYINMKKDINACESDEMCLEIFNIDNGSIRGCFGCNHKINKKP